MRATRSAAPVRYEQSGFIEFEDADETVVIVIRMPGFEADMRRTAHESDQLQEALPGRYDTVGSPLG